MSDYLTARYEGIEAQVTALVRGQWSTGLVYLELTGVMAQLKAIWAYLVGAEVRQNGVAEKLKVTGWDDPRLSANTKYITVKQEGRRLPNGQACLGLLHPLATVTDSNTFFFIVAEPNHEIPPPGFFPRLAEVLALPLQEEWAEQLWTRALEESHSYRALISPLLSHGNAVGYTVNAANSGLWLSIVRLILGFQTCSLCYETGKGFQPHQRYPDSAVNLLCPKCYEREEERTLKYDRSRRISAVPYAK